MDVERLHARRLLSHVATAASSSPAQAGQQQVAEVPARAEAPLSSLDATVITALSLILCGLVIVLAVHSVVRCAFRVTRRACHGVGEPSGGRTDAARERGSSSCQGGPRRTGGARRFRALLLPLVYSPEVELAGCGASECAICLTEFAPGERLRVLPLCNHGFHVKCIDRWLAARQTCPTCRRAPFAIPSLPQASLSEAAETVQTQFNVDTGHPAENNHLP